MWHIAFLFTLFFQVTPLSPEVDHEFLVVDFEGFQDYLSKKSDKVLVVNFWATWCVPCVKELPYFEEAHQYYADSDVEIILVSLDFSNQLDKRLVPFVDDRNIQSEVIVLDDPDANAWIDKVDPSWSGAIPATMVKHGDKKSFYEQSFHSFEELKSIIQPFLKS